MPITKFQQAIFKLLKMHRNPESYIAGDSAINRGDSSIRYSRDIDIFHDSDEAVEKSYSQDIGVLESYGYSCINILNQPSFRRAIVSKNNESLKLEWARDTAFRFFPTIEDKEFGFCLHEVDLAVNKCLALANRAEVRDAIDIIGLHKSCLTLSAICWAACGKDPGFTPIMIVNQMRKHSIFTPDQLNAESLKDPIDPIELKITLNNIFDRVEVEISQYPSKDLGCIYLDKQNCVAKKPLKSGLKNLIPHFGSVKGSWPKKI